MNGFLTMTKTNLKLLLRNIGFLICLVIIPIGAALLLMVQQTGAVEGSESNKIIEVDKNTSVMSASLSSAFEKISVIAIDASQDETSDLFLNTLSQDNFYAVYRCKTVPIERDEINTIAKSFYERGTVTAVLYLPKDFGQKINDGQTPELDIIKGRDDDRIESVKNLINRNISIIMSCAAQSADKQELYKLIDEAFGNLPKSESVIVGTDNTELNLNQTNDLSNIGYSIALLSLAFILTGSFIANQIVSERDNKTQMRIKMSGSSMMTYMLSKSLTAVIVSILQTAVTAITVALLIGTDIGIPFAAYLIFIGTVGIIFNLFCVLMGIFGKNILTAVYTSFGVWVFTNLLAKVYFNFGITPDWWEKASLLTPQRWVMICSEMLMKNQSGAYVTFFAAAAAFLILVIVAGYIGMKLRYSEEGTE